MNGKGSKKGFTLVEMLLVIVIVAVIAAMSVPNLSKIYQTIQLEKTAEDILYLMRYAQSRAITKNVDLKLEFNSDYSQYWLTEKEADPEQFVHFQGRLARKRNITDKIHIKNNHGNIHFYPDGTIEKSEFDVCGLKGRCFTISSKVQRGDVQILKEK